MSWEFLFDRVVPWLLVAQLVLILWNRRELTRPAPRSWNDTAPLVSILVPARNEAETIGRCVEALLAQSYPNLEVIVLDDNSGDETAGIVRGFADPRLQVVAGAPLPEGWTGKNWACHQLSEYASGSLLCFVDADTMLEPSALAAAAGALEDEDAGLVSLLPRTTSGSSAGAVLLPMVTHAAFALFPAHLVHRAKNPLLAVAFGPFVLVTNHAYRASGGHAAHPASVVDDVQLARSVKALGRPVRLRNGTDLVETAWYREVGEMWTGFSKNAYAALDYNRWVAAFVLFVLAPLLLSPFVRVVLGAWEGNIPALAVWQLLLLIANRALTSLLARDPLWSSVFHPVTLAFWASTLAWSVLLSTTGREVVWKGRTVATGGPEQPD